MAGPRRFVRALVAGCAVGVALTWAAGAATPPASAAATATATATAAEPDVAPLAVTIRSMSPGVLPRTGNITVTGTVTNRTDETWTRISLYAFGPTGDTPEVYEPMRNQGELQLAMLAPFDEIVGERFTDVGTTVDDLEPGQSAGYTVSVPADSVEVTRAGVYWFGIHALGESASVPYDLVADGRARTFLPYVPRRYDATPLAASLVVPITQPVRYAEDGSVADVDAWVRALETDGRLSRLLSFVEESDDPVTWLVDPALVDAVAHIAVGNAPRDLGPAPGDGTTDVPTDPTQPTEPTEPAQPTEPTEPAQPTEPTPDAEPLPESARVAAAWLASLGEALRGEEVLTLPYGNVDVPATLAHDPYLLKVALAQRSAALEGLGVDTQPVITSPSGYLDATSIRAADPDSRVLVTDRMFGAEPPAAADADGHRLVVTSYGATQGSPGPGATLSSVGIRQRLLAEAAVRVIKNDRRPLVSVLPLEWALDGPISFFGGLDVPWLDRSGLAQAELAATPTAVSPDDLDYTTLQRRRELDAPTVNGAADLIRAGDTLQNLLVDNVTIGDAITEEALTGLSYYVRYAQASGRVDTARARGLVDGLLASVTINASGVTLSGANGRFQVTLTNDLDYRVIVSVRAESDDGIEIVDPDPIILQPGARNSLLLEARTTTNAVHNVTFMVTDASGEPLGATERVPIRPTRVSGVIWLIMGTGAGLLFLAIAVRLVRRIGAARRGEPGAGLRASRATRASATSKTSESTDHRASVTPVEAG